MSYLAQNVEMLPVENGNSQISLDINGDLVFGANYLPENKMQFLYILSDVEPENGSLVFSVKYNKVFIFDENNKNYDDIKMKIQNFELYTVVATNDSNYTNVVPEISNSSLIELCNYYNNNKQEFKKIMLKYKAYDWLALDDEFAQVLYRVETVDNKVNIKIPEDLLTLTYLSELKFGKNNETSNLLFKKIEWEMATMGFNANQVFHWKNRQVKKVVPLLIENGYRFDTEENPNMETTKLTVYN